MGTGLFRGMGVLCCVMVYVCWFDVAVVLMELKSLVVDLEECTHVWFNLGLMLEVPMTQLNIISNPQPYSRHLHDTLHHWMDTSHDISWEVLIEALEQTSHRRLARELKEEFVQN